MTLGDELFAMCGEMNRVAASTHSAARYQALLDIGAALEGAYEKELALGRASGGMDGVRHLLCANGLLTARMIVSDMMEKANAADRARLGGS